VKIYSIYSTNDIFISPSYTTLKLIIILNIQKYLEVFQKALITFVFQFVHQIMG